MSMGLGLQRVRKRSSELYLKQRRLFRNCHFSHRRQRLCSSQFTESVAALPIISAWPKLLKSFQSGRRSFNPSTSRFRAIFSCFRARFSLVTRQISSSRKSPFSSSIQFSSVCVLWSVQLSSTSVMSFTSLRSTRARCCPWSLSGCSGAWLQAGRPYTPPKHQ